MHAALRNLVKHASGSVRDLAPIVIVIAFFQSVVLRLPLDGLGELLILPA